MTSNGHIHPTRIFKTPEDLTEAWEAFLFDLDLQSSQWQKIQYVGKEGSRKSDGVKVPKTLEGFKRFCRNNYGEVGQYFDNKDSLYGEFVAICRAIKEEIREDQLVGGLLGFYNPSITQRLNNLVEKTEDLTPQAPKKVIVKVNRRENN